ncbi:MAG: DUF4126 domain-containing protein [Anaerolineales bacterium]
MEIVNAVLGVFAAFGLSSSAGLNAYLPLLIVGLAARFTNLLELGEPYDLLANWWVLGAVTILLAIEFFADKVPAVNHVNDIVQTFVRPAAGAILFAASTNVVTSINPVFAMMLGLVVAGTIHAAKSALLRPAVTAVTGGVGNPVVSVIEDIVAAIVSFLAIVVPVIIAALVIVVTAWIVLLLYRRSQRRAVV